MTNQERREALHAANAVASGGAALVTLAGGSPKAAALITLGGLGVALIIEASLGQQPGWTQ